MGYKFSRQDKDRERKKDKDAPVVMDFIVKNEENVYPMVPAGASLMEMIEGEE